MKRYITAGAGSGKTYKITTEVAHRVKHEGLRPEQVIMTTFTKAAAQELREKSQKELIQIGCYKEAQQMEHALIGTVHSVANTFLSKYWYLLGIMPDASAIEEKELQQFRNQSLRNLLSDEDRKFLYKYCEEYEIPYKLEEKKSGLNYGFWKEDLGKVLDYMQWYHITDEQLEQSLRETTESIIKLLEPEEGVDRNNPPQCMQVLFQQMMETVNTARKSAKKEEQKAFLSKVNLVNLSDEDIEKMKKILTDRKIESKEATEFIQWEEAVTNFPLKNVENHRKYAEIIFRIAKEWQKKYREYKDENSLIDFNDMEEMFLQLLDMEEVQADIKARYACIYVDEFQDSNPIQVRIFQKLSTLIDACYVGDKKQAIYGFRGSDTELTTAISDSIEHKERLEHSYRSVEPLVNFSNAVFQKIFKEFDDVTLSMPKEPTKGNRTDIEKPLRLWPWKDDKELALQIQQFILREKLAYNRVAVLAHTNSKLDKLAEELRMIGVPVSRESGEIMESRTGRLMKALLTLMASPNNLLARAEVAYLAESGYNLTKIIEQRLDNISSEELENKDYLNELTIIDRIKTLRNSVKAQSVSALVETLIIELNLYALVNHWEGAKAEETNLQIFIDLAKKYESSATKLAQPATIAGFINYFCHQNPNETTYDQGVQLFTYHKSKGLEWDAVIMLSLDKDVTDENKMATNSILGCHNHRACPPTADMPNPPMTISLVRNIYTKPRQGLAEPILMRLKQHPLWDQISETAQREQARLLYVGVTRARNILVLAAKSKDDAIDLSWFRTTGLRGVKQKLGKEDEQDVLSIGIPLAIECIDMEHLLEGTKVEQKTVFNIVGECLPPGHIRNLSPSKAGRECHELGKIINAKENRMAIRNKKEEEALMGDFIHQVFCCMRNGLTVDDICQLRESYGFNEKNLPHPEKLVESWHYLTEQLTKEYGEAVNQIHELPFRHLNSKGQFVSGYIDFIWETKDAYIVVDYKTCLGDYQLVFSPSSEHYAGYHGDQLDCYQEALEAVGTKSVKARIIYYPVTQFIVEVK